MSLSAESRQVGASDGWQRSPEHCLTTLPDSSVQIINYNLDLVSMSQMGQELAKAAAAPGELGPVGGVDLGRSLRLWLSLQNSLNGLFDSTTAEGGSDGNQVLYVSHIHSTSIPALQVSCNLYYWSTCLMVLASLPKRLWQPSGQSGRSNVRVFKLVLQT